MTKKLKDEVVNAVEADKLKGHNSKPAINPALIELFQKIEKLEEDRRQINRSIRDYIATAKEEHGILSMVMRQELRMRKLDPDVRKQFEGGLKDIGHCLGYQLALDLQDKQPLKQVEDPVEAARKEKAA